MIEETFYTPICPRCDWTGDMTPDSLVALRRADQHIAVHAAQDLAETRELTPFAAAVRANDESEAES